MTDDAAAAARRLKETMPVSPVQANETSTALDLFQPVQQHTTEEIIQQQFLFQQQQQQQNTQQQFEEFKQQMELRFRAEMGRFQLEIQARDNRIQELEFELNTMRDNAMRDNSAVMQYDRVFT
jgi:hypothetical protein